MSPYVLKSIHISKHVCYKYTGFLHQLYLGLRYSVVTQCTQLTRLIHPIVCVSFFLRGKRFLHKSRGGQEFNSQSLVTSVLPWTVCLLVGDIEELVQLLCFSSPLMEFICCNYVWFFFSRTCHKSNSTALVLFCLVYSIIIIITIITCLHPFIQ